MPHVSNVVRRLAVAATVALITGLAGCGGGGSADIVVVGSPPPVTALGIVLTRTGPETVQVDWSDDPFVDFFTVSRDGFVLSDVRSSTTLIDASVVFDQSYCYLVTGHDQAGNLIAASDRACITIIP
jgi:hypothetical protein